MFLNIYFIKNELITFAQIGKKCNLKKKRWPVSNDCGRIKLIILKVIEKSGDSLLIFVIYYYLLPFEFRRWKKSVFFPWLGFFFPNFKCISKKWRKTSIYAFFFKTVTSGQVYHPSITAMCTLHVQRWSLFVRIWQEIISAHCMVLSLSKSQYWMHSIWVVGGEAVLEHLAALRAVREVLQAP